MILRHLAPGITIAALAGVLIWYRAGHDYRSDEPLGLLLGASAYGLVALSVLLRWIARRMKRGDLLFAHDHRYVGAAALVTAAGHASLRFRNYYGLAAFAILLVLFAIYSRPAWRRLGPITVVHRWGGYLLLVLVPVHAVIALFFSSN